MQHFCIGLGLCHKRSSELAPFNFYLFFFFVHFHFSFFVVSLKTSRGNAQSKRMHSLMHHPAFPPSPPPFEHYRFEQFVHLRIHSHSFNSCKNQQWLANFSLHSNRRHTHTHSTQHTHSITLTHTLALTLIHWRTAPDIMEHGITNNECSQQVSNFFEWVTPGIPYSIARKQLKLARKESNKSCQLAARFSSDF